MACSSIQMEAKLRDVNNNSFATLIEHGHISGFDASKGKNKLPGSVPGGLSSITLLLLEMLCCESNEQSSQHDRLTNKGFVHKDGVSVTKIASEMIKALEKYGFLTCIFFHSTEW